MPEGEHETGRAGVKRVQRLLEASMRFRLSYDVYTNEVRTTVRLLPEGKVKRFDLFGDHLDERAQARVPLYVEAKNYEEPGSQGSEFAEFLACAYSATCFEREALGMDPKWEFMWATTCPWKGKGFRKVGSKEAIVKAIQDCNKGETKGKIIPEDHTVDGSLVALISQRLWVWVVSDRHEEMMISDEMQGWIEQKLRVPG